MSDYKTSFVTDHHRGKMQLYRTMQAQQADKDPGDGVYRIRPLVESTVMVGHTMVALRTSVAYDDPHMIGLITANDIPFRVVSRPKAEPERELVPVLAPLKRTPKLKALPLP